MHDSVPKYHDFTYELAECVRTLYTAATYRALSGTRLKTVVSQTPTHRTATQVEPRKTTVEPAV
jgi:hypothetical protein